MVNTIPASEKVPKPEHKNIQKALDKHELDLYALMIYTFVR